MSDRRTRRTRKLLQDSIIELLRRESLSKVTVSQIAAHADVSRQAWHANSLQLVMRLEDRDQLMERIRLHISDLMHMFIRYGREEIASPPLLGYVIDYRSGGMFLLLKSWLHDGCAVPPKEMADLAYELSATYVREPVTRTR